MEFPNIDPVIFEVGPLAVRWYSMSYVLGILLAWYTALKLNKKQPCYIESKAIDDLVVWIIFGIVLGGRFGYVFFYHWSYYSVFPEDILKLWKGGMSFHGAFIGVALAVMLCAKVKKIPLMKLADVCAVGTPIGLMLGRLANFINGELYGRISDVPWAMVFPGDPFTRHPSQLYQAGGEGLLLFLMMLLIGFATKAKEKPGLLTGIFLIGYAFFRGVAELFREPDPQLGFIIEGLTMGQLLSIPMALLGLYFIMSAKRETNHVASA